ncbi:MAG: hypothetical protein EAZ47_01210 [Bacteroidetes bacterium]|nr:MAG: hypothetical protein EAY72_01170 [Bacteroidota bacterium]TAE67301.1 MAG: hypothetical protein EAY68_05440 [Bacteroidota bacterium]TAF98022.1 MAG: hypothetical protein EAZ47_01210 [Bacteroidota bacterium]
MVDMFFVYIFKKNIQIMKQVFTTLALATILVACSTTNNVSNTNEHLRKFNRFSELSSKYKQVDTDILTSKKLMHYIDNGYAIIGQSAVVANEASLTEPPLVGKKVQASLVLLAYAPIEKEEANKELVPYINNNPENEFTLYSILPTDMPYRSFSAKNDIGAVKSDNPNELYKQYAVYLVRWPDAAGSLTRRPERLQPMSTQSTSAITNQNQVWRPNTNTTVVPTSTSGSGTSKF